MHVIENRPCGWPSHIAFAVLAAIICVTVAWYCSGINEAGLSVPLIYDGDGLSHGALIKGALENHWYLVNPALGAPFTMDWHDYPMVEDAHFALIKWIGVFTSDYARVQNVFFLASFATVAFAAYWALGIFALATPWRMFAAIAFSCLPYHFLRSGHLFLSSYFSVPIFVAAAFVIARNTAQAAPFWKNQFHLAQIFLLVVAASSGVYYAYFGCGFITFFALSAGISQRSWRPGVAALIPLAVIIVTVALNLAPDLWYQHEHGVNEAVAHRSTADAELYGLKLTQLILPDKEHPLALFRGIASDYARTAPLVNENSTASLGLIGTLGLIVSIAVVVLGMSRRRAGTVFMLGQANLVGLLYATIGGIGAVIAMAFLPEIRGLNRISVYLGFFSIATVAVLMQHIGDLRTLRRDGTASWILAMLLTAFSIWDQHVWVTAERIAQRVQDYSSDSTFAHALEAGLRSHAQIFMLPYIGFPESAPAYHEGYYAMLRPYLHTQNLAYSYGGFIGTQAGSWSQSTAALPAAAMSEKLLSAGFDAIVICRSAYADSGVAIENQLKKISGEAFAESPDHTWIAYRIR